MSALHDTLADWLSVSGSPYTLDAGGVLRAQRLPRTGGNAYPVDLALVFQPGAGASERLGSSPVTGPPGVTSDAGINWYHTGLQFEARGDVPGLAEEWDAPGRRTTDLLEWVMRRVIMLRAGHTGSHGVRIVNAQLTSAPFFVEQDRDERPLMALLFEMWWQPVPAAAGLRIVWPGDLLIDWPGLGGVVWPDGA